MVTKKSVKKATTRKIAAKKATTKKPTSKKTASKKSTAKKTSVKTAPAKKTTTGKAAAKKTTGKTATRESAKKAKETSAGVESAAPKKAKSGVSSMSVNIGHVFTLRPRVNTSYRRADFMVARQLLENENYANVQEAARAVVEKALELTHRGSPLQRPSPKKR